MSQDYEKIIEYTGKVCVLDQLAEEAAELAQAALKLARVYRGTNPTPVSAETAYNRLIEEYSDVILVGHVLDVYADPEIMAVKTERWLKRLEDDKKLKDIRAKNITAEEACNNIISAVIAYNNLGDPDTLKSMMLGARK